jgi:hypothetical protein
MLWEFKNDNGSFGSGEPEIKPSTIGHASHFSSPKPAIGFTPSSDLRSEYDMQSGFDYGVAEPSLSSSDPKLTTSGTEVSSSGVVHTDLGNFRFKRVSASVSLVITCLTQLPGLY